MLDIISHAKHAEEVVVRNDRSEEDDDDGLYPPAYAKTFYRREVICYRCGKGGHIARECRASFSGVGRGHGGW